MRVGIYDPYLDDLGGGEKYMMSIAHCLSQENTVDVFWDDTADLEALVHRFSLDLSGINCVPNIFSQRFSFLQRLFLSRKYDCIIFLSDGSLPLVASKKLFIHIQQPLATMQSLSFLDKVKVSRVAAFFCNSEYTKSCIDKKFSITTKVLYPPILLPNKKILRQAQDKKENLILTVGRFRVKNVRNGDYKKQGVLLRTFKEVVDRGLKNWKLIIATSIREEDEKEFTKLKEEAKGYPITFLVNMANDKLWNIYAKAKIYWHASGYGEDLEKNPEFAEHFGISTVEAMGAGVVPVVINAGGQKEIVQNGENGLVWDSLNELKKKTLVLIEDKKMWEKLSKSAQRTAKSFAGDRFCRDVHDLVTSS